MFNPIKTVEYFEISTIVPFYVKIPIIRLVSTSGTSYEPRTTFHIYIKLCFSPKQILCDRIFWSSSSQNYLRDFLLKANWISSYSGVDGFQENPRGDSVQSKDNMRIGKILQNIAFIRNSIHRLTQDKQHQILRDSNWASHKILVLPPLLHYVSTSEPLPIIKSIVNCSQCNGFFGTHCFLSFADSLDNWKGKFAPNPPFGSPFLAANFRGSVLAILCHLFWGHNTFLKAEYIYLYII